jgi:hypothetical protein
MPGTWRLGPAFTVSVCLSIILPKHIEWGSSVGTPLLLCFLSPMVQHTGWKLLSGPQDSPPDSNILPNICEHACMPRFANLLEDSVKNGSQMCGDQESSDSGCFHDMNASEP